MVEEQMKMWRLNGFGCHSTLITDIRDFTNYTTSLWREGGRDLGQVCAVVLYATPCSAGEMLRTCRAGRWVSGASRSVHSPGAWLWGPLVISFFPGGLRSWFNVTRFPCLESFQKLLSNLHIPQISVLSYKTENNLVIYLFKLCCCFLIRCHCRWCSQSQHFFSAFALDAWQIIGTVWVSTWARKNRSSFRLLFGTGEWSYFVCFYLNKMFPKSFYFHWN